MLKTLAVLSLLAVTTPMPASAQARVDKNVIYGMHSGLALLLDVHQPGQPNGYGVIFVNGNAWQSSLAYGGASLKDNETPEWIPALLRGGYTVFNINHRTTPRFHFPAPVEDVQRAVRFVRHNARRFGIDPARIAGVGGSSGGHLIGLVAMLDAPGIADDGDPVNREPATLQCLVLRSAPADLTRMVGSSTIATAAVVTFVGRLPTPNADDQKIFRAASPIAQVSPTAPATLLVHGDADDTVPYQQSVAFEAALVAAKVPVRVIRVPAGLHNWDFGARGTPHSQFPEILTQIVGWLDQHLKTTSR
jgi:acetyl esterase/lipase